MGSEKSALESFSSVFKDLVSALRDGVLLLVFMLLLFAPGMVKQRLVAAGFTEGSIAGFEWRAQIQNASEQTKAAGQTVVQASQNYDALIERLDALQSKVSDPALKTEVKDIGEAAQSSRTELASADLALKRSLAAQQDVVSQIAPAAVTDAGWIYLGKVSEDKTSWASGSPQTVASVHAQLTAGDALSVRDDVYLRGDSASTSRATAPVLGVAKSGETLHVLAVDYSHAKGGGWFVWVKVQRG